MNQNGFQAPQTVRTFVPAAYFLAVLMVLLPPLDVYFSMPTTDPGSAMWRFGAIGMITSAVLIPIVGVFLALVTAVAVGHKWPFRIAAAAALVGGIGLTIAVALFAFDALQVRREISPDMVRRFDFTVIKSILSQLAQIIALIVLYVASVRAGRHLPRSGSGHRRRGQTLVRAGE
ncbi:MAG TPA: hypothetical protein VK929_05845 [Longimicrobiales bacterium]|nr:hypothetical protein [Longimicrobiales bacterium]